MRISERWILAAILALGLGLRLIALGSRSLWYDEAFAVLFSEKGLSAMLYGTLTIENGVAADVHPLLYYTLLDLWTRVVGQSPFAVRLLSVIFGVGTIALLYGLIRDLFGIRPALWSAFVIAVAPFHIQYSQEARMYALLGLLSVAATWALVRGMKTEGWGAWIVFGVLSALCMYTQQLAAFTLIALGLIPILARDRGKILRLLVAVGVAVLIYLPWLINLPAQFEKVGSYWVQQPTPASVLLSLWSFVFVEYPATGAQAVFVSTALLLILLILIVLTVVRRPDRWVLMLVWLTLVPMLGLYLVSQVRPIYITRALIPSAIMLYGLIGVCIARFLTYTLPLWGIVRAGFALLAAAGIVTGLIIHYRWDTFPRPPFADFIAEVDPGSRIIHANKISMLSAAYYARVQGKPIDPYYLRDVPGSPEDTLAASTQDVLALPASACIQEAARSADEVQYVIFQRQLAEQGNTDPGLQWLQEHYRLVAAVPYNDLRVFTFADPDPGAVSAEC